MDSTPGESPAADKRRAAGQSGSGHQYKYLRASQYAQAHQGDVYTTSRGAEESDSEPDSQKGMPEGWQVAKSPENDLYYVSPASPASPASHGSGIRTTTWIKPMDCWATADASFREELKETFKAVLQPESERLTTTAACQDYYDSVKARAQHISTACPSRDVMFPQPSTGQSRCRIFTEGNPVIMDGETPSTAVNKLVDLMKQKKDSICILENFNGH